MLLSAIGWIFLGTAAGFVGNRLAHKRGVGVMSDVVLGIVGAVIGGWLFYALGSAAVAGLSLRSLSVAVLAAMLLLFISHAPDAGSSKTEPILVRAQ